MLNPTHFHINSNDFPQAQPYDAHNQRLMENVHPSDWINPEPDGRYNMIVVGAGTVGLGGKVALIERELMGGDSK